MNATVNISRSDSPNGKTEEAFIRKALDEADINVLRMAIYQITKDPELADMTVERRPDRAGFYVSDHLAEKFHAKVKEKALKLLTSDRIDVPPLPTEEETRRMMELFQGQKFSDNEFRFGLEELAFEDFPRDVKWSKAPPKDVLQGFRVLIIGGGIGGISAAIQLSRLGIAYSIVERRADIGGTWEINNYPDARVDVTSFLYQFKFEKHYPWKEYFASRDETKKYVRHVAEKYGVLPHIRMNTEVKTATWDEKTSKWHVVVAQTGNEAKTEALDVDVVISACGLFNRPKMPDIKGIDTFQGAMFHTTSWDATYDYADKRVAIIGNGSSGVQLMPRVAEKAAKLCVFQRSRQWIAPTNNYRREVSPEVQWLMDYVPYYWNWHCYSSYVTTNEAQFLQYHDPEWQKAGGLISEGNDKMRQVLTDYIKSKIGDRPDLLEKLIPTFAPSARRLIIDNGWYDSLKRDNVELVTENIERITPEGILTKDGIERKFDLIVLACGFEVSHFLWPMEFVGRGGITTAELWKKDGPRSYMGITMPGFPNMFIIYGPNGQPRTGGYHSWGEIWSRYISHAIVQLIERNAKSMEVRKDVFDDYNARQDVQMKSVIWEKEGVGGYALANYGRSVIHVPWITHDYHAMVMAPNPDDFEFR